MAPKGKSFVCVGNSDAKYRGTCFLYYVASYHFSYRITSWKICSICMWRTRTFQFDIANVCRFPRGVRYLHVSAAPRVRAWSRTPLNDPTHVRVTSPTGVLGDAGPHRFAGRLCPAGRIRRYWLICQRGSRRSAADVRPLSTELRFHQGQARRGIFNWHPCRSLAGRNSAAVGSLRTISMRPNCGHFILRQANAVTGIILFRAAAACPTGGVPFRPADRLVSQ